MKKLDQIFLWTTTYIAILSNTMVTIDLLGNEAVHIFFQTRLASLLSNLRK